MFRKKVTPSLKLTLICAAMLLIGANSAFAQTVNLDRLLNADASAADPVINPVRKAALDGAAITIGTQTGMIERANEIGKAITRRTRDLDQTFRFGDLVIGKGVLPPVIIRTDNAISVTDNAMRLAGTVYRLIQPARFFSGAPSWRDWLLLGLPVGKDLPEVPRNEQLLPRDAQEREYWKHQVKIAYQNGREQADEIFRNNLAQLVKTYNGMRTFYDLYQRKMVSAPYIASAQEVVTQDDPNMMVVGDTTFRITLPSKLNTDAKAWKAMPATPKAKKRLPILESRTLAQAKKKSEQEKKRASSNKEVQTGSVKESAPVKTVPIKPEKLAPKDVAPTQKEGAPKQHKATSSESKSNKVSMTETAPAKSPNIKSDEISGKGAGAQQGVVASTPTKVENASVASTIYNPPPLF